MEKATRVTPQSRDTFTPAFLAQLEHETPFLLMDLNQVEESYRNFRSLLPDVRVHYAMKCNPDPRILRRLHAVGCSFEIASRAELKKLLAIGVDARDIIFSNPIKRPDDIVYTYKEGVYRFGFDSRSEVDKIAELAPGSSVFVRLKTIAANSVVPSEGKFGVVLQQAVELMLYARQSGLQPYGISFHVGSQMQNPTAWDLAIEQSSELIRALEAENIKVKMLDMGGGFPAHYREKIPELAVFASHIKTSLEKYLPYPVDLIIEPGRGLVGDAGAMVATVIGLAERSGDQWVHLDVGIFNGMMEALETHNSLAFSIGDARDNSKKFTCYLSGPSCDSQDTIMFDAKLSEELAIGDRVFIYTAGAYTTSYSSEFNGFHIPEIHCIGE